MKPPSIPLTDFWQAILAPSRNDLLFSLRNIIAGGLGDRQCKNELETCLQALLAPIRERRATYIQDKGMLLELLRQGSERAHQLTQQTLHEVKRGLGLPVLF